MQPDSCAARRGASGATGPDTQPFVEFFIDCLTIYYEFGLWLNRLLFF